MEFGKPRSNGQKKKTAGFTNPHGENRQVPVIPKMAFVSFFLRIFKSFKKLLVSGMGNKIYIRDFSHFKNDDSNLDEDDFFITPNLTCQGNFESSG